MEECDVIIIGAGAAGLMCAIEAGKRGRKVWLVDHASKIAEKIRISGGGRCNFTNTGTGPDNFLSQNPHFCKSALTQFSQQDFVALVERYGIAYHEKALGQLFCDHKAQDIIDMLLAEAAAANVQLDMQTDILRIEKTDTGFSVETKAQTDAAPVRTSCASLVIATGGLSIPKIGATKFGYDVARQFGLGIVETRAALVPLTFQAEILAQGVNHWPVSRLMRLCVAPKKALARPCCSPIAAFPAPVFCKFRLTGARAWPSRLT